MIGKMVPKLKLLVVIAAVVLIAASVLVVVIQYPGVLGMGNTTSTSSSTVYFTIVDNDPPSPDAGMNGSYYHSLTTPWPAIRVHVGQTVVIHVVNEGVEPHGFAIEHYFDSGVGLQPGESYNLTFFADEAGAFRFFCNIFCAIHPLMQNGQLMVAT